MAVKVCMILLSDYPSDTRVRREAEALIARGDQVDVICPPSTAIGDARELGGVRLYPVGGPIDVRPLGALQYLRRDIAFVVRAMIAAARLHRRNRYDVVQVHTMPDYLVAAALVPKLRGAKVILDVHDLVPELFATKFDVPESARVIGLTRFVERRSVGVADRALAVTESHLDALVAHGNPREKFTVVMNTPVPELFQPLPTPRPVDPFTLVYHGTVASRHGLETAVRAMALVREKTDGVRLEVAGDGDGLEEITSLVGRLGLEDIVSVTPGRRPVSELRPMFERASAGIVPMVNDAFTRHALPVKLLEFIALGLPVISSRTDTVRLYFDDSMIAFFEPGDAAELAERILELKSDPGRAARMSAAAATVLEQHSWEHEARGYFGVVDELARR